MRKIILKMSGVQGYLFCLCKKSKNFLPIKYMCAMYMLKESIDNKYNLQSSFKNK